VFVGVCVDVTVGVDVGVEVFVGVCVDVTVGVGVGQGPDTDEVIPLLPTEPFQLIRGGRLIGYWLFVVNTL